MVLDRLDWQSTPIADGSTHTHMCTFTHAHRGWITDPLNAMGSGARVCLCCIVQRPRRRALPPCCSMLWLLLGSARAPTVLSAHSHTHTARNGSKSHSESVRAMGFCCVCICDRSVVRGVPVVVVVSLQRIRCTSFFFPERDCHCCTHARARCPSHGRAFPPQPPFLQLSPHITHA